MLWSSRSLVLGLLAHSVLVPVRGEHNDPCPNAPTDADDAVDNWCPTHCSGCDVKLFAAAQSGWSPSDDGFDGCVCVVVYGVQVTSISLSPYDDCMVAVNEGSVSGLNAGGGDDFICTGGSDDTQLYGARRRVACVPRGSSPPWVAHSPSPDDSHAGHTAQPPRALCVCRQLWR